MQMEALLTMPFLSVDGMSVHRANSSTSNSSRSSTNGSESADYPDEHCFSQTFPTYLLQDVKCEPASEEYSPPSRLYGYDDSKYSSDQFHLTQLMTYRPHSDSEDSPAVLDATGLMEAHHADPDHYFGTEPPPPSVVVVSPVDMNDADLNPATHAEDYRNLSTITPTLFLTKAYHHADHHSVTNDADTNGISTLVPTNLSPSMRECPKCGSFSSKTWYPDGTGHFLCEACVSYVPAPPPPQTKQPKSKNQRRTGLKKNLNQICANCRTDNTSLWRRDARSNTVCNACGLYYKLHGSDRPLNMRKDSIQKRKRKPKKAHNEVHIEINSSDAVRSPNTQYLPPYSSNHNEVPDRKPFSNSVQTLPSVHSADGFANPLVHFVHSQQRSVSPTSVTSIFNGPVCNYDVYTPSGIVSMGFPGSPPHCSLPPTPPPTSSALGSLLLLQRPSQHESFASYSTTAVVTDL